MLPVLPLLLAVEWKGDAATTADMLNDLDPVLEDGVRLGTGIRLLPDGEVLLDKSGVPLETSA